MLRKLFAYARDYFVLVLVILALSYKFTYLNEAIAPKVAISSAIKTTLFCIAVLMTIWALLLPKRWRAFAWLAINLGLTTLIFADLLYYRYYSDIFAIRAIFYSGQLNSMHDSISTLYRSEDLNLFYDVAALLIYAIFASFRRFSRVEHSLKIRTVIVAVCAAIALYLPYQFLSDYNQKNPYVLTSLWDRVSVGNEIGFITYQILDSYNLVTDKFLSPPLSSTKKQEIADWLAAKNGGDPATKRYHGLAKGKNLIVIQVEALQNFVINHSINGQEITPNLNRLAQEGVYFSNTFMQTSGGNTSDAEMMTNTSLYPAQEGAVFVQYAQNRYNSLGNALKAQGYHTAVLHPYNPTFWNRRNMYPALGYDKFYSFADYKFDEHIGLGLSDKSFLKQSIKKIEALPQPFYTTLVTLSSHFPFNDTEKYGEFNVAPYTGKLLGNYLMAIHYTDAQLGMFINDLKSSGLWDNSVVLLYGDHTAIPFSDKDDLAQYLNFDKDNLLQLQLHLQIPAMLHVPQLPESGKKESFTGQMDFLPTIANLFAAPIPTMLGQDMLNPNGEDIHIFRNGSFITSQYFYNSQNDTVYDLATGQEADKSQFLEKIDLAKKSLETSDLILQYDLIPELNERMK